MFSINKKRTTIILAILIAAGGFLRFYGLSRESLWFDELFSVLVTSSSRMAVVEGFSSVVSTIKNLDTSPPLYYFIPYFIQKYIGNSEGLLRFPSAVFGFFSILAIYFTGKRFYSYKEGLIAAGLMAVSGSCINYSQEARPYSLVLLFSILSAFFWLSVLKDFYEEKKPRLSSALCYILSALIVSYTHYFGLYLVLFQCVMGILLFARNTKALRSLFIIYGVIAVVYSPWIPAYFYQIKHNLIAIEWIQKPTMSDWNSYFYFLFDVPKISAPLYLFLIAYGLYNVVQPAKAKEGFESRRDILVLSWFVIPPLLIYLKSILSFPVFLPRYLIISLPAGYLLVAGALIKVIKKTRGQLVISGLLIIFPLYNLVFIRDYYRTVAKTQWRELSKFIAERYENANSTLFIERGMTGHPSDLLRWYFDKEKLGKRKEVAYGVKGMKVLANTKPQYLWVTCVDPLLMDSDEKFYRFLASLKSGMDLVVYRKYHQAEAWLFKRK
ncbi:MAG: hypothetical protein A2X34_05225 [Elusimicrobia bacterium GWC2_51_8]|nr:MAG: hypothetical protein A2X33_05970 [Elusimicrobia bacterium GWA2_51_34]OGR58004.1 MAG: hypothetical protein A2X34_05225 [Elusimicrobia bacterium GWC2_51_8]OGR88193.1 MAG: hypothetical protein A2021_01115 [Elusimicrobia bacterium GWF2_52_66]HAF95397.1 hypothetical protein [Elusimicrobiota bacterium]HCD38048.1 hypothetical protein [Candidatus Omnitrophota bacterium]